MIKKAKDLKIGDLRGSNLSGSKIKVSQKDELLKSLRIIVEDEKIIEKYN